VTDFQILCPCHRKPVDIILDASSEGKKYYCHISKKQLFNNFILTKEVNMANKPRDPDETWPGDMEEFPDEESSFPEEEENGPPEEEGEEEDTPKEETREDLDEAGFLKKQSEQIELFEGDKIYNVLQTALTDVNGELKKVDKQIDNKKIEKSILIKKKEELQEAIKIYEEQQSDNE
jgi:hypothetical protein